MWIPAPTAGISAPGGSDAFGLLVYQSSLACTTTQIHTHIIKKNKLILKKKRNITYKEQQRTISHMLWECEIRIFSLLFLYLCLVTLPSPIFHSKPRVMSLLLTKWTSLNLEEPAVLPLDRFPARTVTSTLEPRGRQPNLPTQGKGFHHL